MIKLKFAEHRSALTVKAIACKIQITVHLKQLVRSNCSCMLLTHSYNSLCKFGHGKSTKSSACKGVGLKNSNLSFMYSIIYLPCSMKKFGIYYYFTRLSIIRRRIAQHMCCHCRRSTEMNIFHCEFTKLICIYLKKRTVCYNKTLPVLFHFCF